MKILSSSANLKIFPDVVLSQADGAHPGRRLYCYFEAVDIDY